MTQSLYEQNKILLQDLMQQVDIANWSELSQRAQVSGLQIIRLQRGLIGNLSTKTVVKIAQALEISVDRLLSMFLPEYTVSNVAEHSTPEELPNDSTTVEFWQQEYQRLETEIKQQQDSLKQEFQQDSLQMIESWLLQWPTAVAAVTQNPQLPAIKLVTLLKPVEKLLQEWQVKSFYSVGEEMPYDPQWHQLMKGVAEPGDLVKVRYVGYKQGDNLLYKAKVSPLEQIKS